jgi:serine/threonine protein kinase
LFTPRSPTLRLPPEVAKFHQPDHYSMTPIAPGLATALLDRYQLVRELGQGGMATVYLAQDVKHGREVALKVLRPELAAILGRERFLAEIRLTAKLDHPHILTLIDSGETGGYLWYVLPYIRGESLRQKLNRERQLSLTDALAIATDVAAALDYAHARGVIHRDVKPENILIHEGEAMLTDFGIALAVREAGGERLTETGLSVGTPQYMSPEQATADRHLDGRSDIYSLGAVLYEMLAGEPPFSGTSAQAVIAKLMTERPTRLRTVRDTVPEGVDTAAARALAKVPADRFASAAAFAAALHSPSSVELLRPAPRLASRWIGMAVGLLAGFALIGFWLHSRSGTTAKRDPALVAIYQRAIHNYEQRTPTSAAEAIKGFSLALQRDSTYAAAWTGLAMTYVRAYERYFAVPGIDRDSLPRLAVAAVDRALVAEPQSADVWIAQAQVSRLIDPTDRGPPIRSLHRALALDSTSAPAWNWLAMDLAETGDFPGAMEAWRRSITLAPTYTLALGFFAQANVWRRQFDSAAIWADSATALDPNYILGLSVAGYIELGRGNSSRAIAKFEAQRRLATNVELVNALAGRALAEALSGKKEEARVTLRQAESLATAYTPIPLHTAVYMAEAYAGLADANDALGVLSRYAPREDLHFQLHLRCDPPFDGIAPDPRFKTLLLSHFPRPEHGC